MGKRAKKPIIIDFRQSFIISQINSTTFSRLVPHEFANTLAATHQWILNCFLVYKRRNVYLYVKGYVCWFKILENVGKYGGRRISVDSLRWRRFLEQNELGFNLETFEWENYVDPLFYCFSTHNKMNLYFTFTFLAPQLLRNVVLPSNCFFLFAS